MPSDCSTTRRRLLRVGASVGAGLTAGCSGFTASESEEYATMQLLGIINALDDPATVEVRIERDDTGETVRDETYVVEPGTVTETDCVWPDAPLTVLVRRPDGEWSSLSTSGDGGCIGVLGEIDERSPSFFTHTDECPIYDPECHEAVSEHRQS